jgi:hypothetical protein
MNEMQGRGIIEEIEERESKNGQSYLAITIDGERYSLWDKKYFEQINEGDLVAYKWKQSGNFKNITEIERMENDLSLDIRERKLTRMGCLKYAIELASALNELDANDRIGYAIEAAQAFERYVMALVKEDELEQPKKSKSK